MLSTCQVLVKNLKGSEFNVPVSETASLGNILCPVFLREKWLPRKLWVYSWVSHKPEIIMKHSVYKQVHFGSKQPDLVWVRGKLIRPGQRNNEHRQYQPDPVSKHNLLPAETQTRINYPQSVTRSPSSLGVLTTKLCFCSFLCEPASHFDPAAHKFSTGT